LANLSPVSGAVKFSTVFLEVVWQTYEYENVNIIWIVTIFVFFFLNTHLWSWRRYGWRYKGTFMSRWFLSVFIAFELECHACRHAIWSKDELKSSNVLLSQRGSRWVE